MTDYTDLPYTVEAWTNRFHVIDGWIYRDAIVCVAGTRRLFSIPDHPLGGAL